jgi:hypothetical protein
MEWIWSEIFFVHCRSCIQFSLSGKTLISVFSEIFLDNERVSMAAPVRPTMEVDLLFS